MKIYNTDEMENLILHKRQSLTDEDWKALYNTFENMGKDEQSAFARTLAGRILVQTYSMLT